MKRKNEKGAFGALVIMAAVAGCASPGGPPVAPATALEVSAPADELVGSESPAAPVAAPPGLSEHAPPADELEFYSLSDQTGSEPQLVGIGAKAVDSKEWTASVRTEGGSGLCSATLVGERALLIAAHCIKNNGRVTVKIGDLSTVSGSCTHAPKYRPELHYWYETSNDWALCRLDSAVAGVRFENVNLDPAFAPVDWLVQLTGFGCTKRGVPSDKIFRAGDVPVAALPSDTNYILTLGTVAVCYGDSGSGAFAAPDPARPNVGRRLIGVNSRGDISTTSYVSATATADFRAFAASWTAGNRTEICGFSQKARNCR